MFRTFQKNIEKKQKNIFFIEKLFVYLHSK
jgi:hypothetical protein